MTPMSESKCTSRPDCPCAFCIKRNADLAAGLTPGQQLALIAYEWMVDRQMDAEMRERQKRDPAFVEEQRQFVAELLRKFQAATPAARPRRKR
jgi:hypothetical protein